MQTSLTTRLLAVSLALAVAAPASAACPWEGSSISFFRCLADGLVASEAADADLDLRVTDVETAAALQNVRPYFPHADATLECPEGSVAAYTPIGYVGQTGADVCDNLIDGAGTPCVTVDFVAIQVDGRIDDYGPFDVDCSTPLESPWPWGVDSPNPSANPNSWGRGNVQIVCCEDL